MKIWFLFMIANEYDQPPNNIVAWWKSKPSFDVLASALNVKVEKQKGNAFIGKLLKGQKVYDSSRNLFRLRELKEGLLKARLNYD